MPDYGNLLYGDINIFKIITIFFKKIRSKNYVLLYLGVKKNHQGLGNSIIKTIVDNLYYKRSTSISALIGNGKVTGAYFNEIKNSQYRYVLLEKIIRHHQEIN